MKNNAYIYFMANHNNAVIYVGVTNDLERRVWEHKNKVYDDSFTKTYNCNKLVYFEQTTDIRVAIEKEKALKNWKRVWKNELIESQNPDWVDLSVEWGL